VDSCPSFLGGGGTRGEGERGKTLITSAEGEGGGFNNYSSVGGGPDGGYWRSAGSQEGVRSKNERTGNFMTSLWTWRGQNSERNIKYSEEGMERVGRCRKKGRKWQGNPRRSRINETLT